MYGRVRRAAMPKRTKVKVLALLPISLTTDLITECWLPHKIATRFSKKKDAACRWFVIFSVCVTSGEDVVVSPFCFSRCLVLSSVSFPRWAISS